ncbi:MAG TPA: alpha/beta hydrolase [Solirubrobacteraceae bacterium]
MSDRSAGTGPLAFRIRPAVHRWLMIAVLVLFASTVSSDLTGVARAGSGTSAVSAVTRADVVTARTRVAHTAQGAVGYREVGSGSPLVLIMGFSGSMDYWAPSLVNALAAHHTVIVFDNAGVGRTAALTPPLTITAMAEQTSALIATLHLTHPAVLGWSMGGMVAQALAVLRPRQVSALILAATQAGTGESRPIPAGPAAALASPNPAAALSVIFPSDQAAAAHAYVQGILEYKAFYSASALVKTRQTAAINHWMAGRDPAGRKLRAVRLPTLVADGTGDELDPTANDHLLARTVHGARLVLYPDAGHAFLFQDAPAFAARIDRFLR